MLTLASSSVSAHRPAPIVQWCGFFVFFHKLTFMPPQVNFFCGHRFRPVSSRKRQFGCVKKVASCTELTQPRMNSSNRSNQIKVLLVAVYWSHLTQFGPRLMRMTSSSGSVSVTDTRSDEVRVTICLFGPIWSSILISLSYWSCFRQLKRASLCIIRFPLHPAETVGWLPLVLPPSLAEGCPERALRKAHLAV